MFENNCFPLFLDEQEENNKNYEYFSEKAIYPLFHYFTQEMQFDPQIWEGYKKVNKDYAEVIFNILEENDKIWIHDYHLLLLPGLIREKFPNISIGFFLHIPFPSYEIFRTFPWREEILEGLLGADLIGFHTYDDERHFMSCVRRLLGLTTDFDQIPLRKYIVKVDSFPMGINYEKVSENAKQIRGRPKTDRSEIQKQMDEFKNKNKQEDKNKEQEEEKSARDKVDTDSLKKLLEKSLDDE